MIQKIGIRHTEISRLHLQLRSTLLCSLQILFLSAMFSEGEVQGVNIYLKAAPMENERPLYCPALLQLNSLYNVLKCIRDTLRCFRINP